MTPPAAAPTTARRAPAPTRPGGRPASRPRPRPVPDRPRPRSTPPRPAARPAAPTTLGARLARRAGAVVDSPLLDRLIAGRLWIPCIAVALMGLVLLQVSLLQLNSGIGRSVVAASALERENAALKAEVSRLDSGERIQAVARLEGLVMPGPGDRRYLTAGGAGVAAQAASSLAAPSPVVQQPAPPADGSEIVPADPVTPAATEAAPTPQTAPAAVAPTDPAATAAAPAAPVEQAPAPTPEPTAPAVPDATAGGVAPTGG